MSLGMGTKWQIKMERGRARKATPTCKPHRVGNSAVHPLLQNNTTLRPSPPGRHLQAQASIEAPRLLSARLPSPLVHPAFEHRVVEHRGEELLVSLGEPLTMTIGTIACPEDRAAKRTLDTS